MAIETAPHIHYSVQLLCGPLLVSACPGVLPLYNTHIMSGNAPDIYLSESPKIHMLF